MTVIYSPHDKYIKDLLGERDNFAELVKRTFPSELLQKLDLSTLELDNNSYIDENLEEHFSDIVYTCTYNKKTDIKISILFEHKSYAVKYPRLQILKYMVKIWETCEKQNKKLTPVIPVILYHGKQNWNVRELSDYFECVDDILKQYIPDFEYILMDLSKYTDEEIMDSMFERVFLETALLLMKNIFDEDILQDKLEDYFNICCEYLEEEKGLNFLRSSILYLYYAGNLEPEKIIETISKISAKGVEEAMSTATKLMEMGKQEGIKVGIEKNSQEILVKFIQNKFGPDVTNSDISNIQKCNDIDKLKDALEELLSAEDKNAVLDKLK